MLKRKEYLDYILDRLSSLPEKIQIGGKNNLNDENIHAENFYRDFLNLIYGWKLENANKIIGKNTEGFDLICEENHILIQVSSTKNIKNKIEECLEKDIMKKYSNYTFKYMSINDCKKKSISYKNTFKIIFDPEKDILDNSTIYNEIHDFEIDKLEKIYEFIEKQMVKIKKEPDTEKLDSDLTEIINILSKGDYSKTELNVDTFIIDNKIKFNNLNDDLTENIINRLVEYTGKLEGIYKAYAVDGKDIATPVFYKIWEFYNLYSKGDKKIESRVAIFNTIIEEVKKYVLESKNLKKDMTDESLDLCVKIIVVNAFIRCKIFEKPPKKDVIT